MTEKDAKEKATESTVTLTINVEITNNISLACTHQKLGQLFDQDKARNRLNGVCY